MNAQVQEPGRAFEAPFPIYVDLVARRVLVVGGGKVAERKIASLIEAGATVTVVSPHATPAIEANAQLRWHRRGYRRGEMASYSLAFAATDDPAVNAQVASDGIAANVFVNSADDAPNCSFILPAVARGGDLRVAISTNGKSPAMARWLRQRIDRQIAETYSGLLDVLAEVRNEAKHNLSNPSAELWNAAVDDQLLELVASGNSAAARSTLRSRLGLPAAAREAAS